MEFPNKLVAILLLNLLLWLYFGVCLCLLLVGDLVLYWLHNREFLARVAKTFPRDFQGVKLLIKVRKDLKLRLRENRPIHRIFSEDVVPRYSRKVAVVDVESGRQWTFEDVEHLANQVANYFHAQGLREHDVVALFMGNCPEYAPIWLGLSKIGVVSALVNFNLRLDPLAHSIQVANAKCIIVGPDLQTALEDAINNGHIEPTVSTYVYGDVIHSLKATNLQEELRSVSQLPPAVETSTTMRSILIYIYTSGTTGLPKAAKITNTRFYFMARGVFHSFGLRPKDRVYIAMPMYHSAGGILGVGQVFLSGCSAAVRKKFSASRFWDECLQYKCTAAQYIGEICRYLLAQPFREAETQHQVRVMYGNGLRPQIWKEFVHRFGIEKIGEFYGSTEGNTALLNIDNTVGACGFFPLVGGPILRRLYPVAIMKVDEDTGELFRDRQGLCIPSRPGEAGEMIGRIVKGDPIKDFEGYVNDDATSKKIIKNVFSVGDIAFSSGDILHMDQLGYLYFKDRTGDTFRWKGENVATGEVESALHRILGLADATVYGVLIPGMEGRAGMAAIADSNDNCDLQQFQTKLNKSLPPYARPVFLRICKEVDTTGTYKLKKTDLQKQSFDPSKCKSDKLFFLNGKTGTYDPLTPEIHGQIIQGNVKF